MTTDYRALCAELLDALENAIRVIHHEDGTKHISTADAVIAKADAALAQPEPVGPKDEELDELFTEIDQSGESQSWRAYARAVLKRWGRPAVEPVVATDEDLIRVYRAASQPARERGEYCVEQVADGLRAVLARWGHPTLTPIPVSEKMPSAEAGDLDSNGMCWCNGKCGGYDSDPTDRSLWSLSRISDENEYCEEGPPSCTHWLPHWALPFPARSDHH